MIGVSITQMKERVCIHIEVLTTIGKVASIQSTMAIKNISTISEHTVSFKHNFGFPIKAVKPSGEGTPSVDKEAWYQKSFREFCNATALHGYTYIVQPGAPLYER